MRNNYLCQINFKVKLHRQRLFFINEHDVGCSNFLHVVNMVLHGVFKCHAE